MTRSDVTLYDALEDALKRAKKPLDCATLFDMPSIRQHAATVNRVSDYLGNMWRRGDVARLPAPRLKSTRAQWLYAWKGRDVVMPTLDEIRASSEVAAKKVKSLLSRPSLEITEEDKTVTITLPDFTITIKQR